MKRIDDTDIRHIGDILVELMLKQQPEWVILPELSELLKAGPVTRDQLLRCISVKFPKKGEATCDPEQKDC